MGGLVVSLSSIPPRFAGLRTAFDCLLAQTAQIDEIRLYIPKSYRRFPDWDGGLPEVPEGVRILRAEEDLGPATKVVFAAQDLRGEDVRILYCDDDREYLPDHAERLLEEQDAFPSDCVAGLGLLMETFGLPAPCGRRTPAKRRMRKHEPAYRWARLKQQLSNGLLGTDLPKPVRAKTWYAGYADIAEGCGGVLIRPEFLGDDALDVPDWAFFVDDIWLSGQMERNGVGIRVLPRMKDPRTEANHDVDPLWLLSVEGRDRRALNIACIEGMQSTYGIWRAA